MIPEERRKQILELLDRRSYVSVEELAGELYVSLATIRRDLTLLEKEGTILRTHGGASFNKPDSFLSPFALRNKTNIEEKTKIGKIAAGLISNNDTLFVNASSTCYAFAKLIPLDYHLEVLTNGIPLAHHLAEHRNITVSCPGGIYNYNHEGVYGNEVTDFISKRYAKYCFMSCNGLDMEQGASIFSDIDLPLVKAFRKNCDQVVMLVDHTKFDSKYYYKTLAMREIDILITDQRPSNQWVNFCAEQGIQLMY